MPELSLEMEGQIVDYDTADYYLPEKWVNEPQGRELWLIFKTNNSSTPHHYIVVNLPMFCSRGRRIAAGAR